MTTPTEPYRSTLAFPDGRAAAARMAVYLTGPRQIDFAVTTPTGYGVLFPDGTGVCQDLDQNNELRRIRDVDAERRRLHERGLVRHWLGRGAVAGEHGIHLFIFDRAVDESNVSGTGVVAFGAVFPDFQAATKWNGAPVAQLALWDDARTQIPGPHGHGGLTKVLWLTHDGFTETSPLESP